jgi:hypothetical protein
MDCFVVFVVPNTSKTDSNQTASIDRFSVAIMTFLRFQDGSLTTVNGRRRSPVIEMRREQTRPEVVRIVPTIQHPFPDALPSIASIHPTVPTRFTPSRIAQLRTNNSIITDDISFNTATSICAVYMRALRFAAKSLPSLMGTRLQNFESNSLEFQCQPFVFSNVQTETGSRLVSDRVEDRGNECKSKVRTTGKKCEITVLGI